MRSRSLSCRRLLALGVVTLWLNAAGHPAARASTYTFKTLAGIVSMGSADGTGRAARFHYLKDVDFDGDGNMYVADSGNNTIRKVTPAGVVTTFAGTAGALGTADGIGADARFFVPTGVAVNRSTGMVYVVDSGNETVRRITPEGNVITLAGIPGSRGSEDGSGANARFCSPRDLAIDGDGMLYLADACNHTIRSITPAGATATIAGLAGSFGAADGTSGARFSTPTGVAVAGGFVYVADQGNYSVRRIRLTDHQVTTIAGLSGNPGGADGTGTAARFSSLQSLAVDNAGTLYVSDLNRIRTITTAGVVTSIAGSFEDQGAWLDGSGTAALFNSPEGVAFDSAGNLWVADRENNSIRKVTPAGVVTTPVGPGGSISRGDGIGSDARFYQPVGIAVDRRTGVVYVGDTGNATVRRISPGAVVTTLAGSAQRFGGTDGTGSAARFKYPAGMAVDSVGSLYVADADGHTIRKVTPAGVVTTVAGSYGFPGSADGTGAAARFQYPFGVAVHSSGTLYVADRLNATIRKITPAGVVTTLAGAVETKGHDDGTGNAARFTEPGSVAVDDAGNVYVGDFWRDIDVEAIRKITPDGIVSTLAQIPRSPSTDLARGYYPAAVSVNGAGTLVYVVDPINHAVWTVTSAGAVSLVGGTDGSRGSADGESTAARFNTPQAVSVDSAGTLYLADTANNTIRQGILGGAAAPAVSTQPLSQTVVSGQTVQFTSAASGNPPPAYQWQVSSNSGGSWSDLSDTAPYTGSMTGTLTISAASAALTGAQYRAVVTNSVAAVTSSPATLTVSVPPSITGSPSTLTFSATKNGAAGAIVTVTAPQTITVAFAGGTAAWTAVSNQPWLQIGNGSGTGAGTFTAAISDPTNSIGGSTALAATITIASPSLSLTSTVAVSLNVTSTGATSAPFGSFDSPAAGANVEGSIPVTGWALDDVEVARVEIWRDVVGSEPPSSVTPGPTFGKVFIANAFFVSGARPDIETTYAAYPLAHRAGWGYLLMTQGLPNLGNGTFTLHAFAYDREGRSTTLGSKTITGNNASAVKPFGALDVPAYGETKSGTFYTFGWALTPNPNTTDPRTCMITNGNVFIGIDSRPLVAVDYGDARSDIAGFFPGFSNTAGPSGAYLLDTTTLSNGIHQIGWFVVDNCGRSEGMGSRFFTVLNGGSATEPTLEAARAVTAAVARDVSSAPIEVRRGTGTTLVYPGVSGSRVVAIAPQERVEVHLPASAGARYDGYQVVNGDRRALPIGSSFDGGEGTFYWQPGAGFLGGHDLEFVDVDGSLVRVRVVVGTAVHAAIDAPQPGNVAPSFVVAGWAIDEAAGNGTGIDTVHVWAFPAAGGAPTFLGVAEYGDDRPDIAALFGDQFVGSSYSLPVDGLAPGVYDVVVYPHSAVTGDFHGAKIVRVTVR